MSTCMKAMTVMKLTMTRRAFGRHSAFRMYVCSDIPNHVCFMGGSRVNSCSDISPPRLVDFGLLRLGVLSLMRLAMHTNCQAGSMSAMT